jgi:hypothetical protein
MTTCWPPTRRVGQHISSCNRQRDASALLAGLPAAFDVTIRSGMGREPSDLVGRDGGRNRGVCRTFKGRSRWGGPARAMHPGIPCPAYAAAALPAACVRP